MKFQKFTYDIYTDADFLDEAYGFVEMPASV